MCEQPDDGCHGSIQETGSLFVYYTTLSPFWALASDIQKNRHTTLQPWSVSPVAPCSPGGQVGIGAKRKGELTYIPITTIPFSDCRSSHPRLYRVPTR